MTKDEFQAVIDEAASAKDLRKDLRDLDAMFAQTKDPNLAPRAHEAQDRLRKASVKTISASEVSQEVFMQIDGKGCHIHRDGDKIVIQPPGQR